MEPTTTFDDQPTQRAAGQGAQRVIPTPGRVEYVVLLSSLMATAALGIDMMLPAFDEMRSTFGLAPGSPEISGALTAYFLGMSTALLFFGPFSDRFGRRSVIFVGLGIYVAGAIGSALAPSMGVLLISRFIWGVGAAGGRVVVTAVVRDTFVGDAMAKTMSTLMAVFLLVPIIAPSLGAAIVAFLPWQGIFWLCAALGTGLALWAGTRLPETLPIDQRKPIRISVLKNSAGRVFGEPATLLPMLGITALMGVFTSYLGSSELIISEIFGRRDQFPIIFGGTAAVFGAASLLNGRLVDRFGMRRLFIPAISVYVIGAAILLAQAVGSGGRPSFWAFYPILAVVFGSSMIVNPNLNAMALAPVGDIAGTASSIVGAVSMAVGTLIGAMIDRQIDDSVTPFATAVLVSGIVTAVLVVRMLAVDQPEG
ncbi:MAG: multidrug effflux MFS transporter [Acidimicrobiales bacterium]